MMPLGPQAYQVKISRGAIFIRNVIICQHIKSWVEFHMEILLIVANFVPEIGSAAHIYFDLARAFAKRGHAVDVITSYPREFNLDEADRGREFFTLTTERLSAPLSRRVNGNGIR